MYQRVDDWFSMEKFALTGLTHVINIGHRVFLNMLYVTDSMLDTENK